MKLTVTNERTCIRCHNAFPVNGTNHEYCVNCRTGQNGVFAKDRPARFVAIDGEGQTINGEHKYVLLGIGQDHHENPDGMDFLEILEFLYSHFQEGTIYIGFALGYDFNHALKSLPEDRARILLTSEGKTRRYLSKVKRFQPMRYEGWEVDMIGTKQMKFRPSVCDCAMLPGVHQRKTRFGKESCCDQPWAPHCDHKQNAYMAVNDVFSFWQSSFLKVIKRDGWADKACTDCSPKNPCSKHEPCTQDEYAEILRGKGDRAGALLGPEMRRYNLLENSVLERVMGRLDDGFRAIGIHLTPSNYYGPGAAAQAWLMDVLKLPDRAQHNGCEEDCTRKHDHFKRVVPEWFWDAAKDSYYGGWFEIVAHGVVPGISYEYDINSAYPAVIEDLPCLLHPERYSRGTGMPEVTEGELCLVHARVWVPNQGADTGHYIGAMLHRDMKGRINRPQITEGWFWWHELKAAEAAKCITKFRFINRNGNFHEWMKYVPPTECEHGKPLAQIRELYKQRLQVGKESPIGKACKLIYNSAYGKFAQSVGRAKFGNPTFASLITSGCRTKILEAIATHPKGKESVLMVATDAVYFLDPHPELEKNVSQQLGEWSGGQCTPDRCANGKHECGEKHDLVLFKPGVYWDAVTLETVRRGDVAAFKARGIDSKSFSKRLQDVTDHFLSWPHEITYGGSVKWEWQDFTYQPEFQMMTCLQALMQNNWKMAGHVKQGDQCDILKQSPAPIAKRSGILYDEVRGIFRSNLLQLSDVVSQPYRKRFGEEDPWSDESMSIYGVTPDGWVGTEIREAMGMD
jgi:hypothetical protein